MSQIFFILTLISMLAVLGTLVSGMFFMTKNTESSRVKSNKMMVWRVVLQGAAVLFFILAVATQS